MHLSCRKFVVYGLALYNFLIMVFKGGSYSLHDIYTRSSFNGSFEMFSRNVRYYELDVVKKSREKKERKRETEREGEGATINA